MSAESFSFRGDVSFVEWGLVTVEVEVGFWSLVERNVVSCVMADVVLSWSHDFVLGVVEEFVPMGEPSNDTRNHEENCEHVSREAHCFIDDTAIEVNIGIEFSFDEVRIGEGDTFELNCNLY